MSYLVVSSDVTQLDGIAAVIFGVDDDATKGGERGEENETGHVVVERTAGFGFRTHGTVALRLRLHDTVHRRPGDQRARQHGPCIVALVYVELEAKRMKACDSDECIHTCVWRTH